MSATLARPARICRRTRPAASTSRPGPCSAAGAHNLPPSLRQRIHAPGRLQAIGTFRSLASIAVSKQWEFFTHLSHWLTDAPRPAGLSSHLYEWRTPTIQTRRPREPTQGGTDHEREKKSTGKKRETSWPERTSYKGHTIVITAARTPDVAAKARSATEGQTLQIAIDGQPLEVLQIEPRRFESIRMPPIGATSRRSTSRATSSISTPHFVAAERPLRWRPPRLPASTRRTQQ